MPDKKEQGKQFEDGSRGKKIDRRSFLKQTAAAGGAAVISAAVPGYSGRKVASASDSAPASTSVNPEIPPDPIPDSSISATLEADVVVVGAGLAGLSAARAASEAGASVVVVEKAETYQYRSGQFGIIDSKVQKALGIEIDKNAAVLESLKQMGYRADQRIWNYWADHSGAAFDWMLELAPDVDVIPQNALSYDESKITLQPLHFPRPSGYDLKKEFSPCFPTVMCFIPDQGKMLERVYQRCLERGCRFKFATWARQLMRPGNQGRVKGIICQDAAGAYSRISAVKGVVLATGDFAGNRDMVAFYTPWAAKYQSFFPSRDAAGSPTNTGDGQRMGIWAGAKMEDGPHAPMTHSMGGALGVDGFFLVNTEGRRFVNEDVSGSQLSSQLFRQPGNIAWQIFDDKWPEQIGHMGVSHGSVNYCVEPEKNPQLKGAGMTTGRTPYTTREAVRSSRGIVIADTLKALAEKMDIDATARETLLTSIARYNELCRMGVDEDFGKTPGRLFPIATPPFYASRISSGGMLVCMGGLTCDPETGNVLDTDYRKIEGLYAAGNTMGGRFLVDYPVVVAGASHGFALTYGRLVGNTLASL